MATSRGSYFSPPDQGPQEVGSTTVKLSDPSNERDFRTIEQQVSQQRNKITQDASVNEYHQNKLIEKLQTEYDSRSKTFKLEQDDNKLVANAILKNYQIEAEKIDARAKSSKLKYDAVQQILGTGASIAANQAQKQKVRQKEWGKKTAASLNTDLKVAPELNALTDWWQNPEDQKKTNAMREALGPKGAGWSEKKIDELVGKSKREQKYLIESLKLEQAKNTSLILNTIGKKQNVIQLPDGRKINYAQLIESEIKGKTSREVEGLMALGNKNLKDWLLAEYPDNAQYMGEAFDMWATKGSLGRVKTLESQATQEALVVGLKTTYSVPYQLYKKESGGDGAKALNRAYDAYILTKPDNVTTKEWGQKFFDFVSYGIRAGEFSLEQIDEIDRLQVTHSGMSDGQGGFKKVPAGQVIDKSQFYEAAAEFRTKKAKEGATHNTLIKDLASYGFKNYNEKNLREEARTGEITSNEDHLLNARQLVETGRPENIMLARKIIGTYIKGQGSATQIMETWQEETIAEKILKNPTEVDENYIKSLPGVSSVWKAKKIKELKQSGSLIPGVVNGINIKENYDRKRKSAETQIAKLGSAYKLGSNVFQGDTSVSNAMLGAVQDFDQRVKLKVTELLSDKKTKDLPLNQIWEQAMAHAQSLFADELKDGEAGKGKYATGQTIEEGLNSFPYFKPATAEQYHGPLKFSSMTWSVTQAGGGDTAAIKYLSDGNNRIVQSDRIEQITNSNSRDYPRIVYEIAKKYRITEDEVWKGLVAGENDRRKGTNRPLLKIDKPDEISQAFDKQKASIPLVHQWPYAPEGSTIFSYGIANKNDWSLESLVKNNLTAALNPSLFDELIAGGYV
tara:strand:- start:578 stop:3127 length:2550 start_codon:yes stop_codon:yes gene_type:complete